MAPSSYFRTLPLFLAFLSAPVTAWVFSWTTPDGTLLTNHGDSELSCKDMNNPKGNVYDWDPQSGHWCIFMYGVKGCSANNTDDAVGYTCKPWPWANHVSGKQIYSYQVINDTAGYASSSAAAEPTSTSTSSTSTQTTTSTSVQQTSATPTSSSDSDTGSSASTNQKTTGSSSLSGGAIAGIVVGVLAAVIIAGLLFFFLYWRRRKSSKTEKDLPAYASAPSPPPAPMSATTATGTSELQGYEKQQHFEKDGLEPGQKLNELRGDQNHVLEMEQGTVRAELDGSPR